MTETIQLPEEMLINIGSESKEFAVRSRRKAPIGSSISRIIFGLVWLGFISVFIFLFLGPVFKGESTTFLQNGKETTVSADNLKPALFLIVFSAIFVAVGLFMLIPGIISLFKSGGYFAGTPTRLVWYKKGALKTMDWSQFTGNIEIRGTNTRGSITMEMKTGKMVSGKGGSRYVPDVVYMIGIPSAYEIEQICRRRIEEHHDK